MTDKCKIKHLIGSRNLIIRGASNGISFVCLLGIVCQILNRNHHKIVVAKKWVIDPLLNKTRTMWNCSMIFHKTEIQMVILRCLVCLNLNWVKSYDIFWLKYLFFHAWKSIISGVKYRSKFWYLRRKPAVMFSKWVFFQNSLVMSWAI